MTELQDRYIRSKVIILSLLSLLVGFVLLFVYAIYQRRITPWLQTILQELASVLIISGTVSLVTEYFTRSEYVSEILQSERRIRTSLLTSDRLKRLGCLGVVDCFADAGVYDYSQFINDATDLTICVNDGRSWLSGHIHPLRQHLGDPDSKTVFITLHPGCSYTSILAGKVGSSPEFLSEKIRDSCHRLVETYRGLEDSKGGELQIYWQKLPVTNAVFLSENGAIIGPYNLSRPRSRVPLIMLANLGKDSYYYLVKQDLNRLRSDAEATCVFSAKHGNVSHISPEFEQL